MAGDGVYRKPKFHQVTVEEVANAIALATIKEFRNESQWAPISFSPHWYGPVVFNGKTCRNAYSLVLEGDDVVQTGWKSLDFSDCHFEVNGLGSVTFTDCTFRQCRFRLGTVRLVGCKFFECDVQCLHIDGERLLFEDCQVGGINRSDAETRWLQLDEVTFNRVKFTSRLISGLMKTTTFSNTVCASVQVVDCEFETVNFENCRFDSATRFHRFSFTDWTVDRVFLESLGEARGGLTDADLRKMTVIDPIAQVRMEFGGWKFVIHSVAVVLFLSPVVSVLVWKWIEHLWGLRNGPIKADEPTEWLAVYLLRYWYNGGRNLDEWRFSWPFVLSLPFILYNFARFGLLWKTKQMEHKREIVGIWPDFSLSETIPVLCYCRGFRRLTWGHLLTFVKWGTLAAIPLGIWHFALYLTILVRR